MISNLIKLVEEGNDSTSVVDSLSSTVLVLDYSIMFGCQIMQKLLHDGKCNVIYSPVFGHDADNRYSDLLCTGLGAKVLVDGWTKALDIVDKIIVTGVEHRGFVVNYLEDCVGSNELSAQLELDRGIGQEYAKKIGIACPEQVEFHSIDEVTEYIENNLDRYVFKLNQTLRSACETIVATEEDSSDLVTTLSQVGHKLKLAKSGMYLQKYVSGTEVSIEGWFDGKLVDDRLFASYDSRAGFVYDLTVNPERLIDKKKLVNILSELNYIGPFSINGIFDGKTFNYLEWTMRFGAGLTDFFCHTTSDLYNLISNKSGIVAKDKDNQLIVIVNARIVEPDQSKDNILLVDTESLPVVNKNSSLWIDNVYCDGDKYMVLPVNPEENRKGRYVANATTLDEAVDLIEDLESEASIAECAIAVEELRKDTEERINIIRKYLVG
jgi:hypothetical protein